MAPSRSHSCIRPGRRSRALLIAAMAALCLLPLDGASGLRLPVDEQGRQVRVYVMWNRDYLSIAAKVPDTMITATSTAPMSVPEQDDAIELAFEMSGQPGTPAYRLIISAAGGMTLYARDGWGRWRADRSWISGPRTVKYAVSVDGTLNDPHSEDTGFTVECAIPWEFLSESPPGGADIGFNVVCWMQGENQGIASWSPAVREPAHVGDAARWGRMHVRLGSELAKATGTRVPCPIVAQTPFIDGMLAANEWLAASTLEFDKPEPLIDSLPEPQQGSPRATTLMAIYRYDWCGGIAPQDGAPFWTADGMPATSDQPQGGTGPWVSYASVAWHARQLEEVQRAGIDVILARYSGEEDARRSWARIGLSRLGQALKERRAEGLGYPLVGMMLDTAALRGADLTSEPGKQLLYGMVREFFLHVPREYWAEVGRAPEKGAPGGVPILLGEPDGLADWDGGFLDFGQGRFGEDLLGARLVWLGSSAWRRKGAELYSHISLPRETGFSVSSPVGATAVALSPGRCPAPGTSGAIRSRAEGRAYRSDWQRALAAKPELIIIDSWNDYANGTEVGPSRQYGVLYVDATRYFQSRLGSQQPQRLALKQHRVPTPVPPGSDCQAELLVENTTTEDLQTGARVSVDYEIRRLADGAVVRTQKGAQALAVSAGQTRRVPARIPAKDDEGRPLSPGDYVYTVRVVRSRVAYLSSEWFTRTLAELSMAIRVGYPPPYKATLISSSLPSAIAPGARREITVRLRNDGAEAWHPARVQLSYHWTRHLNDLRVSSDGASEIVVRDAARVDLPRDVLPGDIVSLTIPLVAADQDGDALPPASPDHLWHYRVQWALVEGDSNWFSSHGTAPGDEAIQVVHGGSSAVIESVSAPAELNAEESTNAEVVIANATDDLLRAGDARVVVRWHRWDGRPAEARVEPADLPVDIEPGTRAFVRVPLAAPLEPGPYRLIAWLATGGGRADTLCGDSASCSPPIQVFVRSDRFRTIDLSPYTNVVAVVSDNHRSRGDFDGRGRSLPAEWLPPDQSAPREHLYPGGYCAPGQAQTSVVFAFPSTSAGIAGAVACNKQSLPFGEQGARHIHIVAASTAGAYETRFGLTSATGETEFADVLVPSWDERSAGVPVAAYCPYVRTLSEDTLQNVYLYHLTLTPRAAAAVSLELPEAPWIKILAVTVESP